MASNRGINPEIAELIERATELAGVAATTELWCISAQTLIYDMRDFLRESYPPDITLYHCGPHVWGEERPK